GQVSVETEPGKGTRFRIILLMTRATFRGVYVGVHDQQFIVPTAQIEQCVRIGREHIKSVENRETILWRNEVVALISLAEILELTQRTNDTNTDDDIHVLILGKTDQRIALQVDDIVC